jgi:peptidylprolyl isomerase
MESKIISNGDRVKVEYIAYLTSGQIVDQSKGKGPLEFVVGSGELIKGFDEAVVGMGIGQEKTVTIPPEKAYGVAKGSHPLGGQTMIFWIKVVEIN